MTTSQLLWGTTWRGTAWGLLVGAGLGMAYGAVFAMFLLLVGVDKEGLFVLSPNQISGGIAAILFIALIGSIMGGTFGIPTGAVVGLLNGLLVGILTRAFFFPLRDARTYRRVMALISAVFAAIASWLGFVAIMLLYANRDRANVPLLATLVVIPALIAGIAAVFISQFIARWYVRESTKGIAQNVLPN